MNFGEKDYEKFNLLSSASKGALNVKLFFIYG